MPTFEVEDSVTGKRLRLEGDSPPTEEELEAIFSRFRPQERTLGQEVTRGIGLAARDVAEGAAGLAGIVTDPIGAGVNRASEFFGGPSLSSQNLREDVGAFLTNIGVPEPEGLTEEIASRINQAVVGGGGSIGIGTQLARGSGVTRAVGDVLQSNRAIQGASAVTGVGAGEAAREAGAGPGGQVIAGLTGAIAPGVVASRGPETIRGAFRGGEAGRQRVAENIESFRTAGTEPTVAQATEGRLARAAESLLSRSPGGAGVITRTARGQADDLGAELERRAVQLVGRAPSGEQAGRAIEEGVRRNFMRRFRDVQRRLWGQVDEASDSSRRIRVDNYRRTLDDIGRPIEGAEATSGRLTNATIRGLADDLGVDAADGTLPYQAVSALRSRLGERLNSVNLTDDIDRATIKRLYGSLTEDIRDSLDDPKALSAWRRANRHTAAGHDRIERIEAVIKRKGGPERIFQAAMSGTKDGATTLRSLMQSLPVAGRRMVTSAVLRRLGVARASSQNATGDAFSTETFLTNWNNLSREAKRTLFDRQGATFRRDMDRIARFASNLREGSQIFRNPSGTAQAQTQAATAGAFVLSLLTGNFAAGTAVAGSAVVGNLTARLMTNPNFVHWLARSTEFPVGSLPALINQLRELAQKTGDVDLAETVVLLEKSGVNSEAN